MIHEDIISARVKDSYDFALRASGKLLSTTF